MKNRQEKAVRVAVFVLLAALTAASPAVQAAESDGAEETITIADEVVPLADIVIEEQAEQRAWWWLVVPAGIAVAAGIGLCRRHIPRTEAVIAEYVEYEE